MKTGFICASGFNLVASATRNGKRLIAVVLGAPSSACAPPRPRSCSSAASTATALSWLTPSLGTVEHAAADRRRAARSARGDVRQAPQAARRGRGRRRFTRASDNTDCGDGLARRQGLHAARPGAGAGQEPQLVAFARPAEEAGDPRICHRAAARRRQGRPQGPAHRRAGSNSNAPDCDRQAAGRTRRRSAAVRTGPARHQPWMSFAPPARAEPAPPTAAPGATDAKVTSPQSKPEAQTKLPPSPRSPASPSLLEPPSRLRPQACG